MNEKIHFPSVSKSLLLLQLLVSTKLGTGLGKVFSAYKSSTEFFLKIFLSLVPSVYIAALLEKSSHQTSAVSGQSCAQPRSRNLVFFSFAQVVKMEAGDATEKGISTRSFAAMRTGDMPTATASGNRLLGWQKPPGLLG